MTEHRARRTLLAATVETERRGLNHNTSGNLSQRLGAGRMLVTPSGVPTAELGPGDLVLLELDGTPVRPAQARPTSEWRLHAAIYQRRPEVEAVVHTHSPEATAVSALRRPVPAVHYVVARVGGPILSCAEYATYGSAELAANVVQTLGNDGLACLMANHGAIAVADDVHAALALAHDVEWLCGVYRRAIALGEPVVLPPEEIDQVAERFATYGQVNADADRRRS